MKIGLVDAATVAKVVGVSRQRINNLVADGVLPRADRGRFDLPSTVQAFFAHKYAKAHAGDVEAKSLTSERSRLARLKADAAEREARISTGEYVRATDVEMLFTDATATLRSKILLGPSKLAARMAPAMTPAQAQDILRKEAYATLSALAALATPA